MTSADSADGVEVRPAGPKGLGVFALRPFVEGDVLMRFTGRLVQQDELGQLSDWEQEHLGEVGPTTYQVLPVPRCYLNHACDPNAISNATIVVARRAIAEGDEITIDYRVNAHEEPAWLMACHCEGAAPHEVVGDFFAMPMPQQVEFLPFAPAFIQDEFTRRLG